MQYPRDYLKKAYEIVRESGGLCIADEVRCVLSSIFAPPHTGASPPPPPPPQCGVPPASQYRQWIQIAAGIVIMRCQQD